MNASRRLPFLTLLILLLGWATTARAQGPSEPANATPQSGAGSPQADDSLRPATTTFFGDTGLWFVPTAEILPAGKWSVSGYRGTNFIQRGSRTLATLPVTFAVGFANRAEISARCWSTRGSTRDLYPLFFNGGPHLRRRPRPVPARESALDRRSHRRLLSGRQNQFHVPSGPEAGRPRAARHREDSNRRQEHRQQYGQGRWGHRLHRQQGIQEAGRGTGFGRLRISRSARRLGRRPARCAGARACGFPSRNFTR